MLVLLFACATETPTPSGYAGFDRYDCADAPITVQTEFPPPVLCWYTDSGPDEAQVWLPCGYDVTGGELATHGEWRECVLYVGRMDLVQPTGE